MGRGERAALLLALVLSGVPHVTAAQGRFIHGVIVDSAGTPVPYANVIAVGSQRRIAATADGVFRLSMDSSANRAITVRRMGYLPITIELETWPDTAVRVVLAQATRTLSAVRIEVERSAALAIRGFYDRMNDVERGINYGHFITPEEIEQRKGSKPTDFFQGIPGIRVTRVKTGDPRIRLKSDKHGWEVQGIGHCRMEVFIDGNRTNALVNTRRNLDENYMFLDDIVHLTSIAGIEVYPRSVQAPPRYQSLNGTCGVILIWTK